MVWNIKPTKTNLSKTILFIHSFLTCDISYIFYIRKQVILLEQRVSVFQTPVTVFNSENASKEEIIVAREVKGQENKSLLENFQTQSLYVN